jgi:hypothetical protein
MVVWKCMGSVVRFVDFEQPVCAFEWLYGGGLGDCGAGLEV